MESVGYSEKGLVSQCNWQKHPSHDAVCSEGFIHPVMLSGEQ